VDDSVETTASVFVEIGGGTLSQNAVRSIQALVANAVLGLSLTNVAVVDNNGNVLSRDQEEDDIMQAGSSVVEYRQNLEKYFGKKVESMLESVVGVGNVVVRVATEVDASSTSTVKEDFNDDGGVLRESNTTEQVNSTVVSEIIKGAGEEGGAQSGGGTTSNRTQDETVDRVQKYEIDKTITNRVEAPGRIERISASVFVAMKMKPGETEGAEAVPVPRTAAEMDQLRQMVANALGIVPSNENFELIAIQETVFNRPVNPMGPIGSSEGIDFSQLMQHTDQIIGGLISVIILLVFLSMLKRARSERGLLDRVREIRMEERAESSVMANQALTPEILNGLIRQKPENVSTNLRKWLSGGGVQ
jgi:flagellar M-ring protein FliF